MTTLENTFQISWQHFVNQRSIDPAEMAKPLLNKSSDFYEGLLTSLLLTSKSLGHKIQVGTELGDTYLALFAYVNHLTNSNNKSQNHMLDEGLKKFSDAYEMIILNDRAIYSKIVDKETEKPTGYYCGFAEGVRLAARIIPDLKQLNNLEAKLWFTIFTYCVQKIYKRLNQN